MANECVFEWDGDGWVRVSCDCEEGYRPCDPPPQPPFHDEDKTKTLPCDPIESDTP
jgi:hypothetical protein